MRTGVDAVPSWAWERRSEIAVRIAEGWKSKDFHLPAVWELLCEAAEEIERLRALLAARERFLKALRAARDKRSGKKR
jgi:hypothetical protein